MNILLDLHTHTIMSGHAYSTLQEMVKEAAERNLKILGITEHGPGIPGTCDPIYFRNIHVVPRKMYGVELLLGSELNILDYNGTLDLDPYYYELMDIRIAGIHSLCYTPGTIEENTSAMIGAISNPYVDIISHPGDGTALIDFEPVVKAAKEFHTLLEINNSSLSPTRNKPQAKSNNLEILRLCKTYEIPIILGSDAHISFDIANYEFIYPLLNETEFPEELIINRQPKALIARLQKQKGTHNLHKA
ncbi:MAG: phosphatase [Bacteroidales bacterium]|nr:phosphatase [Bacteroidales bacterium]